MMRTLRWSVGMVLVGLLTVAPALRAQNSAYSVVGIGFPSSPWSVVARSMGGSIAAVDPLSPLNPGAIGLIRVLSVQAASMQEFRHYSIGGVEATGLQQTRFPYASATAPLGPKFAYGIGFTQYAERTYDVATTDSVVLRGSQVGVSDHNQSAGGMVDIRGALAWTYSPKLSLGIAGHAIGGSAKVTTNRVFSDSAYTTVNDRVDAIFSGYGVSAGVIVVPTPALHFGASVRLDTRLNRTIAGNPVTSVDLPVTLAGGVEYRPSPFIRFATTEIWRSWSGAAADLAAGGTRAFNTFDTGIGFEIGRGRGGSPLPLRLGFRYATLPFSPTSEQPHEIDVSAGTGVSLSRGRALVNAAIERAMRDGGGASERAWQLTIGFQIRP